MMPAASFSGLEIKDSKIPSVIFYDESSQIKAIGPQTTQNNFIQESEENDWIKVEQYVISPLSKNNYRLIDDNREASNYISSLLDQPGRKAIRILQIILGERQQKQCWVTSCIISMKRLSPTSS